MRMPVPTLPGPSATELTGRSAEIAVIRQFLAGPGSGGALQLAGEPGAGLSSLLGVAGEIARANGFQVVHAKAASGGRAARPLSGLLRVVRPLLEGAPHRPDVLRQILQPEQHNGDAVVLALGLVDLLGARAASGPLLLVLDDVGDLDRTSSDVMGFVGRQLAGTGASLLSAITRRRGPSAQPRQGTLEVQPLDAVGARKLLLSQYPDLSDVMAAEILQTAAGNPLALRELPAVLTEQQRATACPRALPVAMTTTLLRRWAPYLAGLPASTTELLLLAALHRAPTLERLTRAVGTSDFLARLGPAEQAGVLRITTDGALQFTHPLLATAVVARAGAPERARAHARWARACEEEPQDIAWHREHASAKLDTVLAPRLLETAAKAQRMGEYRESQLLLVRAAELAAEPSVAGAHLAYAAYLAAVRVGAAEETFVLLQRARDKEDRITSTLRYSMTVAVLQLGQNGLQSVIDQLAEAIETQTEDPALMDAVRLLWVMNTVSGDPRTWQRLRRVLRSIPHELPADLQLARVVTLRALGEAADLAIAETVIAGLSPRSSREEVMVVARCALLLNRVDDCRAALRWFQPGTGPSDLLGLEAQTLLAICHLTSGEWTAAERVISEQTFPPGFEVPQLVLGVFQTVLKALRGEDEPERAEDVLGQAEAWAEPMGIKVVGWLAAWARALMANSRADSAAVYRHLQTIAPHGRLPLLVGLPVRAALELVESAVRTGHRAEAVALVRQMRAGQVGDLSRHQKIVLLACRAMVEDDPARAERLFERALAAAADDVHPFDTARITLFFGEQQRAMRQLARSRALLASARDTFAWLGCTLWARRAAQELRAAGRGSRHARAQVSAKDELSPQELRIAHLAASGLTNKEIGRKLLLSPRTVGNYLHRIYPRLGVTSRAGLGPALGEGHLTWRPGDPRVSA